MDEKRKALEKAREARANGRLKGLSRKRAWKAFCWLCCGWSSYIECLDSACPGYAFRPENKQDAGEPDLWWMEPSNRWVELYSKAKGIKPPKGEGEES